MMNRILTLILLAGCLMLSAQVDSVDVPGKKADSTSVADSSGYLDPSVSPDLKNLPGEELKSTPNLDVFRYVLGLAIVFGMLFLFVVMIRRLMGKGRFLSNLDPEARILDVCPLNPRLSIYIVRLFGEIIVLGVSPDGVRLLYKIDETEKVNAIADRVGVTNTLQFKTLLDRWMKKPEK